MTKNINSVNSVNDKSWYDLTLAEFPIAILSRGIKKELDFIHYSDTITLEGKLLKRDWRVYPHPTHGFGTESTLDTIFEIFQLWKEQGFENEWIEYVSNYHLLKRMGKKTGFSQYKQISRDLDVITGMQIIAQKAFWDSDQKTYIDKKRFSLFLETDEYEQKDPKQPTLFQSRIRASTVLHQSVLNGSLIILEFDPEFYHKLKGVQKTLACYLSKVKNQTITRRDLRELAEQVSIYANDTKHIKQQFKRACTGLIDKGFKNLDDFSFEKGKDGKEQIIFKKTERPQPKIPQKKPDNKSKMDSGYIELIVKDIMEVCGDKHSIDFYRKVANRADEQTIRRVISEVKSAKAMGEIKKSPGHMFTTRIMELTSGRGINLREKK